MARTAKNLPHYLSKKRHSPSQLELFEEYDPKPVAAPLSYQVRESERAKYVRLKVSLERGIEVILPKNFDRRILPGILAEKRPWIENSLQKLTRERLIIQTSNAPTRFRLPTELFFFAISELWRIDFFPEAKSATTLQELERGLLLFTGNLRETLFCRELLSRWINERAKFVLIPWLQTLSEELDLPFKSAHIRSQRTRWASCSSRKAINLNRNLLFLPPELTRYVMIHELCHIVHLNHSPAFWKLVAEKDPDYRQHDKALRTANRLVPNWLWK
ncbi:MAG: M48 family metallopeptidase [Chlorobiales bacterium]|nr:M48 family metallopeptidase [Chlorobiales bacterium]